MVLQWLAHSGTWAPYELPPHLVHGVALISGSGPNICVYGRDGLLTLQIGSDKYRLENDSPRIKCRSGPLLLGLRRRFTLRTRNGKVLFSHRYWRGHGRDFFHWLAIRAGDPRWRTVCGEQWSRGVEASLAAQ